MKSKKVLFINQEMVPYVPESAIALDGRSLPQTFVEQGCEIRTFMPRWGIINERRNQLHEVIRLSGMNIIIDDTDHPLIIKVASIQAARMQVYFIDNDDYFHKRSMMVDDKGAEYADNIERAIFYARGVLETVKKLRWCPDVIYCQGWISAIAPFYIKTAYREEPPFTNAKVVCSLYGPTLHDLSSPRFEECIKFRNAGNEQLKEAGIDIANLKALEQISLAYCDGVVEGEPGAQPEMIAQAQKMGLPVLKAQEEQDKTTALSDFFDSIL